jgi:hypothetical protein
LIGHLKFAASDTGKFIARHIPGIGQLGLYQGIPVFKMYNTDLIDFRAFLAVLI